MNIYLLIMDINMNSVRTSDEDESLDLIFSRHLQAPTLLDKVKVGFNVESINKNKQLLSAFQKEKLIKKETFFAGEEIPDDDAMEGEFEEIFKEEEYMDYKTEGNESKADNSKKKTKENYFTQIIDETKKNDFLYCPYLDQFDSIWVKNNCNQSKDKSVLSCCGCFTNVSHSHERLKNFTNISVSREMRNVFIDYFQVYDYDMLVELFKENINNFKYSKEFLAEAGILAESKNHFVGVKCSVCYTLVAVFDADSKAYYVFNAI